MLNPKQRAFAAEYLVDLNATQAAIRAGYSKKTADVQGPRLLGNAGVACEIRELLAARGRRLEITQDRVVQELARVAFADVKDFGSWGDGAIGIKASDELDKDQTPAIQEITSTKRTDGSVQTRLKLHDKIGALTLLGKHLGMFVDRTKIEGDITYSIKLPEDFPSTTPAAPADAASHATDD